MDPIVIALATAVGTLIGTSAGILVMRGKLRPPITETELAGLKEKLRAGEASLAESVTSLEDLRKQVAQRDKTLQQDADELQKRQQQHELALAETQKEVARRTSAEQKVQELGAQLVAVNDQCTTLSAKVKEGTELVASQWSQIAAFETQVDALKKQLHDSTAEAARLKEAAAELQRSAGQESNQRAALEAQLTAERQRLEQLTAQLADAQIERSRFEGRLQEERQSAAKGMELLLMAQEKLSHVFSAQAAAGSKSENGHSPLPPPESPSADTDQVAELARSVASSN